MSAKNDGGPAYPAILVPPGDPRWPREPGMSLRQWYAGMAMEGWLGSWVRELGGNAAEEATEAKRVAQLAFAIADALLEIEAQEADQAEE